jgi:hypothetical protein
MRCDRWISLADYLELGLSSPSMIAAPLRVPVELRLAEMPSADGDLRGRWYRLATEVSDAELELSTAVPEELDGTVELTFYVPGAKEPVRCRAAAHEIVVGEEAQRRRLRFLDLDEAGRRRIDAYVQERVASAWTR